MTPLKNVDGIVIFEWRPIHNPSLNVQFLRCSFDNPHAVTMGTYHCCTCPMTELFKTKCFPLGHETLIPYHLEVWLQQWVNVYSFHYKKVLCSLEKIGNKHVLSFLFHYIRISMWQQENFRDSFICRYF